MNIKGKIAEKQLDPKVVMIRTSSEFQNQAQCSFHPETLYETWIKAKQRALNLYGDFY